MQINKAIIIAAFLFCAPLFAKAATPGCFSVDASLSCASLGSYSLSSNYIRDCTAALPAGAVCCCPENAIAAPSASPRLLIIGSVAAFFAIITVLILVFRKNE